MISCTEFIPAYSELFTFLEKKDGPEAVSEYWEHIAANGLPELESLVKQFGIAGCYKYWSHTLNEEAADFTMTLDEDNRVFTIDMHYCPSKGRLLQFKHITPYHNYCKHCDILYRRVLEPLGYTYEYDMTRTGQAQCSCKITQPKAE
ncbi:MAG: hypothetical protein Q4G68_05985 [Planctomycetia bacterium]|nr:hypothetical protein [Planctomycetia bacterium]